MKRLNTCKQNDKLQQANGRRSSKSVKSVRLAMHLPRSRNTTRCFLLTFSSIQPFVKANPYPTQELPTRHRIDTTSLPITISANNNHEQQPEQYLPAAAERSNLHSSRSFKP
mmetsp:Transcript_11489/g.24215  ORF Transcript_11489/g.24215 Transcript_11489/m.24215 type:complete len:112 (+) Transcript_11489:119-454(+)